MANAKAKAKARKAITLLNLVAIAGYYTHAVTIQHVGESATVCSVISFSKFTKDALCLPGCLRFGRSKWLCVRLR